jgi:hypothetical protein
VIADFGVCPFTIDAEKAGIPVGAVRYSPLCAIRAMIERNAYRYRVSRAHTAEEAFYRFWEEVAGLLTKDDKVLVSLVIHYLFFILFRLAYYVCFSNQS